MRLALVLLLLVKVTYGAVSQQLTDRLISNGPIEENKPVVMNRNVLQEILKSVFPKSTSVTPYNEGQSTGTGSQPGQNQQHLKKYYALIEQNRKKHEHKNEVPSSNKENEQVQNGPLNPYLPQTMYQRISEENTPNRHNVNQQHALESQNLYQQLAQRIGQAGYQQSPANIYKMPPQIPEQYYKQPGEEYEKRETQNVEEKRQAHPQQPITYLPPSVNYQRFLKDNYAKNLYQEQGSQGVPQVPRHTAYQNMYQLQGTENSPNEEEENVEESSTPSYIHQQTVQSAQRQPVFNRPTYSHPPTVGGHVSPHYYQQRNQDFLPTPQIPKFKAPVDYQQHKHHSPTVYQRPTQQAGGTATDNAYHRYNQFLRNIQASQAGEEEEEREGEDENSEAVAPQQRVFRRVQQGAIKVIHVPTTT